MLGGSLLLTACGGGGDAPAPDAAAPAAEPAPAAEAAPAAGAPAAEGLLALGETKYGQVCVTCHMADGNGMPGAFPPLAGSEWATTAEVNVPISVVLHGMQGAITVKGQQYNGVMVPWNSLTDEEIAAVLTYVRSSWGNSASAVTTEQVAAVRTAEGARASWTPEELKAKYPGM
jgi:mono/diheme cytochrome c family protein